MSFKFHKTFITLTVSMCFATLDAPTVGGSADSDYFDDDQTIVFPSSFAKLVLLSS